MTSETAAVPNDELDRHVDEEIKQCLDPQAPRSFFLFAGAGSGQRWPSKRSKMMAAAARTLR